MIIPGVTGFGTGTLTATAPPDAWLAIRFFDSHGMPLDTTDVPPGQTRKIPERGTYATVAVVIPALKRRKPKPVDARDRMRAAGLDESFIEAMLADG